MKKICNKCKQKKLVLLFWKNKKNKDRFHSSCKECCSKFRKKSNKHNTEDKLGTKICTKCGQEKNYSDFYKDSQKKEGYRPSCIFCDKKIRNNPPKEISKIGGKICSKCKRDKPFNGFWKCNQKKDGYRPSCKECDLLVHNEYRNNNKGKERIRQRIYMKNRVNKNPQIKLQRRMSCAIYRALKDNNINKNRLKTFEDILKYSSKELIQHLESLFELGMSLDNYGQGKGKWHIDHVIPLSWFNYTSIDDEEFKKCWALDNLQPMWGVENIIKRNKYFGKYKNEPIKNN